MAKDPSEYPVHRDVVPIKLLVGLARDPATMRNRRPDTIDRICLHPRDLNTDLGGDRRYALYEFLTSTTTGLDDAL